MPLSAVLVEMLEELLVLARLNHELQMDKFNYTEGKITQPSSSSHGDVVADYMAEDGDNLCVTRTDSC